MKTLLCVPITASTPEGMAREIEAAAKAGADMIGFNFYPPSPRYIEPETCQWIVEEAKKRNFTALFIGVFVNEPVNSVINTLNACHLDLAQLSGDEPPEDLIKLGERAYKGLRIRRKNYAVEEILRYPKRSSPPAWLIDAYSVGMYGETGEKSDWELARDLAAEYPILLAGGLNPQNVIEAMDRVQPWGVDVASGVESSAGCKDLTKVRLFIQTVKKRIYHERYPEYI